MATISYKETSLQLKQLIHTTTAQELGYDLLRIFARTRQISINRIKEGKRKLSQKR